MQPFGPRGSYLESGTPRRELEFAMTPRRFTSRVQAIPHSDCIVGVYSLQCDGSLRVPSTLSWACRVVLSPSPHWVTLSRLHVRTRSFFRQILRSCFLRSQAMLHSASETRIKVPLLFGHNNNWPLPREQPHLSSSSSASRPTIPRVAQLIEKRLRAPQLLLV